jgi:hypothetical protein
LSIARSAASGGPEKSAVTLRAWSIDTTHGPLTAQATMPQPSKMLSAAVAVAVSWTAVPGR